MAQLPLRTRRLLARGYSRRDVRVIGNRVTIGDGNRERLTTSLAGANNDITFVSKTTGTGTIPTITLAVAGASTPLTVAVSGVNITVNVATNGSSAATSTAADVVRAVNFSTLANPLVWAQLAPANDGTGVVTALAQTPLAGATATPSP